MSDIELKPCPFCGSEDISVHAYSIDPSCYIVCEKCGASIESKVSWGEMSEQEHDDECYKVLAELWNRRTPNE